MIRLLGSPRTLCDGRTRREFLHIGGLGALGLGLSDALRFWASGAGPARRAAGFGSAKACILLFPYGSPPQHETFDPKPDAPAEIQGEMKAIRTAVPGLWVCDRLPNVARVMERVTVVRSMTHPYPEHGVAYAVSGIPTYTPDLETRPRDPRHWPFIGSVVDYLEERRTGERIPPVPRNVGLPWLLNSKTDLNVSAGPYAAFLGKAYDPVWTDYDGAGTRFTPRYTEGQVREFKSPFGGVIPGGRFNLSSSMQLPADVPAVRLERRRSLLQQFDNQRRSSDEALMHGLKLRANAGGPLPSAEASYDRYQEMAFSLVTTPAMRQALDVGREPLALRESYGMTLFGQGCLAARRLVEAGCKFVTLFWDGYGQFSGCAWDTHAYHYPRLKEYLLPGFDLAFAGLIRDLEARGLLDETLVIWMSEHGRTPKIDSKPKGAGRHHWSRAYSIALAGAGVPRGKIVGSTDKLGGDVCDTPVSPKDILATSFHLLGIDPHTTITDQLGRPVPIAGQGEPRPELLS
jgi:hypothetical protein